jgi:hypothetical protein
VGIDANERTVVVRRIVVIIIMNEEAMISQEFWPVNPLLGKTSGRNRTNAGEGPVLSQPNAESNKSQLVDRITEG